MLLVDDDIRLHPRAVDRLFEALLGDPDAVLAAATLTNDPALATATGLLYRLLGLGYVNPLHGTSRLRWSGHSVLQLRPRGTERADVTHLCCTLLPRQLAVHVRLDETFAGYVVGEDLDFTARVARRGQLLHVQHARADILAQPSSAPADPRALGRIHGEVLSYFRWRHRRPGFGGALAWGWSHVGQVLVLAARATRKRDAADLIGYISGLCACVARLGAGR